MYSNLIFYPEGSSLVYHGYSFYNLFLSFVMNLFLTPAATYNVLILSTFLLSGIGAFLLIRYLVRDSYVALICGYIFAFNPSHYAHSLHHINISSIQFIPFFVLFFLKAIKGNSKADLCLSLVFFILVTACDWNYLIFMGFFMGFTYIYLMIVQRKIFISRIIIKMAFIIGGTLLFFSPWLIPMITTGLAHREASYAGHNIYVADLAGFFTPPSHHLLGGLKVIKDINETFRGLSWESTAYFGIANLLIMLFAFRKTINVTAKYYLGLLVFSLLSMGTSVILLGNSLQIPLPYYIFQYVPFLRNSRAPSRNIMLAYLFLAIIMAFALKHIFALSRKHNKLKFLSAILILVIFLDYYSVCREKTEVYLPKCYDYIKKDEGSFGILDLPCGYSENSRYMMYQTLHDIPIVQGLISRKIGRSLQNWLLLYDMQRLKKQLTDDRVKYIVYYKYLLDSKGIDDIKGYRNKFKCVYEDDDCVVFSVY